MPHVRLFAADLENMIFAVQFFLMINSLRHFKGAVRTNRHGSVCIGLCLHAQLSNHPVLIVSVVRCEGVK